MSANRKEHRSSRNVTFEPAMSVRSHRHQASDSGVGSDQSSYGTSPDRSTAAQAYFDLHKAHLTVKEENTKLQEKLREIERKLRDAQDETRDARDKLHDTQDELRDTQDELRDAGAHSRALQNQIDVLKENEATVLREKRSLKDQNEVLKDELRKARTRQPRDDTNMTMTMTGALPPSPPPKEKEKSRRSESKMRHKDDKEREKRHKEDKPRHKEDKEREKRIKEDKERLMNRFEHKDKTDDRSVSSGGSSGRSNRESYIESYGPSAPRPPVVETVHRPRTNRSESSYSHRPAVIATTTLADPVYSGVARSSHQSGYPDENAYLPERGRRGGY